MLRKACHVTPPEWHGAPAHLTVYDTPVTPTRIKPTATPAQPRGGFCFISNIIQHTWQCRTSEYVHADALFNAFYFLFQRAINRNHVPSTPRSPVMAARAAVPPKQMRFLIWQNSQSFHTNKITQKNAHINKYKKNMHVYIHLYIHTSSSSWVIGITGPFQDQKFPFLFVWCVSVPVL